MQPSREQYAALCETLSVGLSLVHVPDPDDPETMRIVFNNAAASSMSEADLRSVVGMLFLEAFPGLRGSPFPEFYSRVIREQTVITLPDIVYGDALVPEAAFSVRLVPLPGNLVAGEYVNVTQQRRAEGRLRAVNEALMELVTERTVSLEESLRKLQSVGHAAAHELQGPLWTIIGYLGVIRDALPATPANRELIEMLSRAEEASARLRTRIAGLAADAARAPGAAPPGAAPRTP